MNTPGIPSATSRGTRHWFGRLPEYRIDGPQTTNLMRNTSRVPTKVFPHLEVLDRIATTVNQLTPGTLPDLSKIVIIGTQHLLETTGSLIETLIALGAKPELIFLAGKNYSTSPNVAKKLAKMRVNITPGTAPRKLGEFTGTHQEDARQSWRLCEQTLKAQKDIQGIIIIDSSSVVTENIPSYISVNYPVIGLELTRAGAYNPHHQTPDFPIISIAQCAVKKFIEPPLIQRSLLTKLGPILKGASKHLRMGVVGYGAIGSALTKGLLDAGYAVIIFDENGDTYQSRPKINRLTIATSLQDILSHADYIFGCTGTDITRNLSLLDFNGKSRTFISVSSGDVEFRTLLQAIEKDNPNARWDANDTIKLKSNTGINGLTILKRGYPATFDRTGTSVPSDQIAITRGLILAGIVQALILIRQGKADIRNVVMLDHAIQQQILKMWASTMHHSVTRTLPLENFEDADWVVANSEGKNLALQLPDFECNAGKQARAAPAATIAAAKL